VTDLQRQMLWAGIPHMCMRPWLVQSMHFWPNWPHTVVVVPG
jgi:hypothetical protein